MHQGVLDAVVDHLGEVARALRAGVHQPTTLWCQRLEDRSAVLENLRLRADHQRIAVLEPPDAARRARVDIVQPASFNACRVFEGDLPVGVAAVDHNVAWLTQIGQLLNRLGGRFTRGHHHPRHPRPLSEGPEQRLERARALGAFGLASADGLVRSVVDKNSMSVAKQARDHVAAHASQADHPDFHGSLLESSLLDSADQR